MKFFYTSILTFTLTFIYGQQGDFLMTEHFSDNSILDNTNFEITNDYLGRLCVANRSGILKYDGEAWDYYKTPSAALSLAVDSSNVVYVGCIGSVGMIDFKGRQIVYQQIAAPDSSNNLFLETLFNKGKAYFLSDEKLIVYDTQTKESKQFDGFFLNIFKLGGEVYVNNANYETLLIADTLAKSGIDKQLSYTDSFKKNPELSIDFEGKLWTYENANFKALPQNKIIEQRGYEIQEATWINDSLFVCSTMESGILFFNINDPEYIDVSNYYSGLPDNEVYALHTDDNQNVWVAHQFGITQISPLFPAYSFSNFPGLDGNLISINNYKKRLWVSTSLGLYCFNRDTVFETKVYYEVVKKKTTAKKSAPQSKKTTPQKTTPQPKKVTPPPKAKEKNKPFIKRLFSKKQRAKKEKEPTAEKEKEQKGLFKSISKAFNKGVDKVTKVKGKIAKNTRYIRRTKKVPVDVRYGFKKIEGTNGKFLKATLYKNKLLAISTSGVYEIKGDRAEIVIEEDIETFTINKNDQLVISTSYLAVKAYKLIKEVWVEQISQPTGDIIVGLKSSKDGSLWMAGANTLYKTSLTDTDFSLLNTYDVDNQYLDLVNLIDINEKTYFVNSQGYFYYDKASDAIEEDTKLKDEIGKPLHHLYDQNEDALWVYSGKLWSKITSDGKKIPYEYLSLFPDLRSISTSEDSKSIWLVTGDNDLLKYNPDSDGNLNGSTLFVRQVSNEKGNLNQSREFVLNHDENFLSVQLSKPDFLGLLKPEFQYKLEGLNTSWSEWTKSKTIDFSFLPEGKYELKVRSRDTFGRVEESSMLSFRVKPPYWETPWFYALQVIFFGSLVVLSARLNQNNSANRFLSGSLTILTLVLIIEFLQSTITSYVTLQNSPVIEFVIDACVAFMIFPLEKFLRELMTTGKLTFTSRKKKPA